LGSEIALPFFVCVLFFTSAVQSPLGPATLRPTLPLRASVRGRAGRALPQSGATSSIRTIPTLCGPASLAVIAVLRGLGLHVCHLASRLVASACVVPQLPVVHAATYLSQRAADQVAPDRVACCSTSDLWIVFAPMAVYYAETNQLYDRWKDISLPRR